MQSITRIFWVVLLLLRVAAPSVAQLPARPITLIGESSNNHLLFVYYQNEFQNQVQLRFQPDTVTGRRQPLQLAAKHPLWLQLSNSMDQYLVYAQPGDTIYIQTHPNKQPYYTFRSPPRHGTRQAELNFFNALKRRGLDMSLPDAANLFINVRYPFQVPRLREQFDQRMAYLQGQRDSLHVSPAFVTFASRQIRAQYLSALFWPYYNKERVFDQFPASYPQMLDAAGAAGFLTNDTLALTSQIYRGSATGYVRYLSRAALGTPAELATLYRQASTALRGRTRDYVLFYLLKQNLGKQLPTFATYLDWFRHDCATPAYVQYIDSVNRRPALIQMQPDLLQTPLLSSTGETLTWAQLVARNHGKVLYLDLWASWCGPCLAEMPASAKLQTALTGQAVQFVYFSIDQDKSKWLKAVAAHELARPGTQHYLLDPTSTLAKFLKAPPIPRYVLLDKQGQAVSLDAARPSDPLLLPDVAKLLK